MFKIYANIPSLKAGTPMHISEELSTAEAQAQNVGALVGKVPLILYEPEQCAFEFSEPN